MAGPARTPFTPATWALIQQVMDRIAESLTERDVSPSEIPIQNTVDNAVAVACAVFLKAADLDEYERRLEAFAEEIGFDEERG